MEDQGLRSPALNGKVMRMKKTATMMVAMVALLVALFAAAAYADTITGTKYGDYLDVETSGDDRIYGRGGADDIFATNWAQDTDKLYGGRGADALDAWDGDGSDILNGGRGLDDCWGDPLMDTFVGCESINGMPA